ncbi:hypothetical protein P168DRAFT_278187 [Aspergillus campestris IBT 28561]|uniref:Uncharacterized protein n=1 Tax=Aspergillus campestris (strain IBT 28561) TaxID=1392248 RepID=A0A2I1DFG9_ASPC2|nr:uncharacterized protein P168DRAFT_278187 [Aspergillus campestris IBT 28561]PKY08619.1 hypothetical protein P168DRAFT_278187 [Aspergillus campestris IBT 28561]
MFPNALDSRDHDADASRIYVQRELNMMDVMNHISEKPMWYHKVFDEKITSKWRDEIATSDLDVTPKMFDWIVQEMQWKASVYEEKKLLQVFDMGVVRSDTAVPEDLQQALRDAVAPLENVPEDEKDYHPGSDNKVVDLVHPSLYPLVYGHTRILPDRTLSLTDCLDSAGKGEVIPTPTLDPALWPFASEIGNAFSTKFQWLPCEVRFTPDSDSECRITSYINNLAPFKHRALYSAIEGVLARAIPLWDQSLTAVHGYRRDRIPYREVEYVARDTPEPVAKDEEEEDSYEFSDRWCEWSHSRPIKLPEPEGEFCPPEPYERISLREKFREEGLQVIVKLANIELGPEKPEYGGGSWHIEGQLNERICATAIYYYDSTNITSSRLSFRQRAAQLDSVHYEQSHHEFIQAVYGFGPEVSGGYGGENLTQDLGSVLCPAGRLLTFPNTVQHRVAPFELADRSRRGHRKILALFLVDPLRRVISTANVPPQQVEWARERAGLNTQPLKYHPEYHPDIPPPLYNMTQPLLLVLEKSVECLSLFLVWVAQLISMIIK